MKYFVFHDEQGAISGNGSSLDGTIPAGAVECTEEQHANLDAFKVDVSRAEPSIMQRDALEVAEQKYLSDMACVLFEIREQRAPMLNALNGIASRAVRSGDAATAAGADTAAQGLLDITQDPALRNANTQAAMRAAVLARYRELVHAAPETVKSAFREVMG
jgi:hypothetical protein